MSVILRFIGSILQFLDNLTGNYILALALFALIIQILLLPLAIKQQKNSIKQARLAPKIAAIRKKYAGRDDQKTKQKIQQETMDLYQQEGFNPAGGCLPLLIQAPIILVLYQVIIKPLSFVVGLSADAIAAIGEKLVSLGVYSAEGFDVTKISQIELVGKMQSVGLDQFSSIGEMAGKTLPNFQFGPFDLAVAPNAAVRTAEGGWQWSWLLLIPIVSLVMMYLSQMITRKLTYQSPEAVEQQKSISMRIMNLAMPLFSAYIAYIWPAAIGIYWFIRNVYQVIQQVIVAKLMPLPKFTAEDYKEAEREYKGKAPKKIEKSENAGSVRSLFHIDDDDYVAPEVKDEPKAVSKSSGAIEAAPLKDAPKKDGDDADPDGED